MDFAKTAACSALKFAELSNTGHNAAAKETTKSTKGQFFAVPEKAVKRQNGQGNQMTFLNRMTQVSELIMILKLKSFWIDLNLYWLRMNKVKEL